MKGADIVLENFGPGTIERLKCGWDDLRKINPKLIYLSMKGFLKGPYEARGALDEVVQMQSGLAYMTGPPGRPLRAGAPIIDLMGGVFGVVAALAALRERDLTGKGQRVSSSLFESATFVLGALVAGSAVIGGPVPPMPARKTPGASTMSSPPGTAARPSSVARPMATGRGSVPCSASRTGLSDPALSSNASRCEARTGCCPNLKRI